MVRLSWLSTRSTSTWRRVPVGSTPPASCSTSARLFSPFSSYTAGRRTMPATVTWPLKGNTWIVSPASSLCIVLLMPGAAKGRKHRHLLEELLSPIMLQQT